MKWNTSYYRFVESDRPLTTLVPALQYVKRILPHRSFDIWPPSSIRRKKKDADGFGDSGEELEDVMFARALYCTNLGLIWLCSPRLTMIAKYFLRVEFSHMSIIARYSYFRKFMYVNFTPQEFDLSFTKNEL